ncbi:MAG: deoxyribonuclease IV [Limisphaerales bacterium]
MKFGAHCSTAGGYWRALERGASVNCEIVQIFVKNNMQWLGRLPVQSEIDEFARAKKQYKFAKIFGHTGYLINLAANPSPNRDKSLQSLIQEIQIAHLLEVPFLVMHPGAHLGAGEAHGFKQVIKGLNEVFTATRDANVRIALENTAGQGSCFGNRIEHLAEIFNGVDKPERLGLCIDTCHLFAAGYDVRTPKGWNGAIGDIVKLIGRKQILAFHLNDSKTDLGSRVDRHAHIGQGKIGRVGFKHIVNDARFKTTPGCLETPKGKDLKDDVMNLGVLRSLVKQSK